MSGLIQIIVGAFMLSIVHAAIPNHWLPLLTLSKSEKWNNRFTLNITPIAGFAHTLSTIIIGIIVGFLGYKLSCSYSFIVGVIAPSILILLGIIYLVSSFISNKNHHHHHHSHEINIDEKKKRTTTAIILALTVSMFFTLLRNWSLLFCYKQYWLTKYNCSFCCLYCYNNCLNDFTSLAGIERS